MKKITLIIAIIFSIIFTSTYASEKIVTNSHELVGNKTNAHIIKKNILLYPPARYIVFTSNGGLYLLTIYQDADGNATGSTITYLGPEYGY